MVTWSATKLACHLVRGDKQQQSLEAASSGSPPIKDYHSVENSSCPKIKSKIVFYSSEGRKKKGSGKICKPNPT
ncbi:uncharacterized protein DMAD_11129 [Drosophila madeirensis]|uniref:Uncharacterized protein n=1 Tax=Drosophila madeirensis TaxID=30013 RepID=A0AAU9FC11_DROMD